MIDDGTGGQTGGERGVSDGDLTGAAENGSGCAQVEKPRGCSSAVERQLPNEAHDVAPLAIPDDSRVARETTEPYATPRGTPEPVVKPVDSGAVFSDCGAYRYRLWRVWDASLPVVLWIMLNPSTADASKDDPTIKRCQAFARRWGYGGVVVVNLFALRSPHPRDLLGHPDPIGPGNDAWIFAEAAAAGLVVAAWGTNAGLRSRGARIRRLLGERGVALHHIGLTQDGYPKHPLARGKHRVGDEQHPVAWPRP